MPKYLIEREIPNAGALTPDEMQGVAATSEPPWINLPSCCRRRKSGVANGATSAPRLKMGIGDAIANSNCRSKMSGPS